MQKVRHVAVLGMLLAAACGSPSQPLATTGKASGASVQPGRDFQLAVGAAARIEGTASRIVFRSVKDDSMCAADVQCVWAGSAKVVLILLTEGQADREIVINTGVEPRSASLSGFVLRLTSLSPVPRAGSPIPAGSYVATFELTAA